MEGIRKNRSLRAAVWEEMKNWSRGIPQRRLEKARLTCEWIVPANLWTSPWVPQWLSPLNNSRACDNAESLKYTHRMCLGIYILWQASQMILTLVTQKQWVRVLTHTFSVERLMTEALACWRPKLWLRSKSPQLLVSSHFGYAEQTTHSQTGETSSLSREQLCNDPTDSQKWERCTTERNITR